MSRAELLLFGQKQLELAEEVYAVYEAGPLGYGLCRELQALGIKAYVCAPEAWKVAALGESTTSWMHINWLAGWPVIWTGIGTC